MLIASADLTRTSLSGQVAVARGWQRDVEQLEVMLGELR